MPSLDGSLIAVGIAAGGSERSALTVFDTATGKQVGTAFVAMGFPGKLRSVAWLPGNKGFIYAGYPPSGCGAQATILKNQKVFEHMLGTPETEDRVVLDKGLTPLAQIALDSDPTGKWIVASAEDGDGGTYANFVRELDGSWEQFSTYSDEIVTVTPGTAQEDTLYLTSLKDAPRGKILEISAKTPVLREARTIIPEGAASIQHDGPEGDAHPVLVTKDRLYVTTIDGGPNACSGVRPQRQATPGSTVAPSFRSGRSNGRGPGNPGNPGEWLPDSACLPRPIMRACRLNWRPPRFLNRLTTLFRVMSSTDVSRPQRMGPRFP